MEMIKMIELESVNCVVDPKNHIVYSLFEDGTIDLGSDVHIYEVTDEWFESLSEYDLNLLIKKGIYEILK